MNKRLLSIAFAALAAVTLASLTSSHLTASVYNGPGVDAGIQAMAGIGGISTSADIKQLIVSVIVAILDVVTTIALLGVIVAGIYLIVSNGDEGQKDKAKKIILYIIIGILVILFARVIVVYVSTLF